MKHIQQPSNEMASARDAGVRWQWLPAGSLVLSTLMLVAVVAGQGCTAQSVPSPKADSAAERSAVSWQPELIDIHHGRHQPFATSGARAFVIIFVLPDCPIANSYAPELNRLHDWLKDQGMPLLLVHADPQTTVAEARQHTLDYDLQAPVVLDPEQVWAKIAGATRVPEAAVFSREGEILYRGRINDRHVAFGKRRAQATRHDLREAVAAIVAGKPVPHPRTEAVGCFIQLPEQPPDTTTSAGVP